MGGLHEAKFNFILWRQQRRGGSPVELQDCIPGGSRPPRAPTWIQRSLRFSGSGQMVTGHLASSAMALTAATKSSLSSTLGSEVAQSWGCSGAGQDAATVCHHPPAHKDLQRRQGVGRHDPRSHAENHRVREDRYLEQALQGRGGTQGVGPSLPNLCVKPSPTDGVTFSGLSSSVTWKDTSPEKPASGKESPSTKKVLSSWCRLGFTA